jgi:hypothetical protein
VKDAHAAIGELSPDERERFGEAVEAWARESEEGGRDG